MCVCPGFTEVITNDNNINIILTEDIKIYNLR